MPQLIYRLFACLLLCQFSYAQDVVYLTDQTSALGKLAEITTEKVSLLVTKGESSVIFSYGFNRVAAVVNQYGRFLCPNQLSNLSVAEQEVRIRQFMMDTNPAQHDIIIRASPLEAIYGTVSYAQGEVVNYTTPDGTISSLPKSALVGIFYRTGKHELIADASLLCTTAGLIGKEPTKPTAQSTSQPASGKVLQPTDAELKDYQVQGLERVEEFAILLGVIADKTTEAGQKDKAISQVLKMFKPDASIQVSSMVRDGQTNTYRIKDYLIRLKLLRYKQVVLEWSDIQYVQDLTQKDDGNYYGKIKGEQRFSGLDRQGEVQYGDITQKDVEVMLTPYKKSKEGEPEQKWAILLGNVGVTATQ